MAPDVRTIMNKIAGTILPIIVGFASIGLGLVLPVFPFITAYLGWYVWAISVPMIAGGLLCTTGGILANRNESLAYVLVMAGGLVGILTLLALPSLQLIRGTEEERGRKSPHYLLVMPVLVAYALFVMFVVDLQDKTHLPITQLGRNGLPLMDTIWDADVFFGEIWFNLLLACLLVAMLSFKIHPGNTSAWKFTIEKERVVLVASGLVSIGLLVAMAATWEPSFSIAANWYPTQFAYQVPAWPAIIGFAGLAIGTLNIKKNGSRGSRVAWLFVFVFLAIWLYLTSITNFNPHAIFNFSIPLHVLVTTIAFPCCLVVYAVERMKAKPETKDPAVKRPGLLCLPVLIGGLAILALLQVAASTTAPGLGAGDMFSAEIYWWWPLSHAWGWLFTGSTTIFALFAMKGLYRLYGQRQAPRPAQVLVSRVKTSRIVTALLLAGVVAGGTLPLLFVTSAQWSDRAQPTLLVNQVGYLPAAPKRVLFQSGTEQQPVPDGASFSVIDESTGLSAYDGLLVKNVTNRYGHNYMVGSFDGVSASGRYHVRATVDGKEYWSPSFDIGPGVYEKAMELALRFFYYQRCNYEVSEVVPSYDGHHACHLDDADVWEIGRASCRERVYSYV
jgi:hypothetical protein